MMTIINNDGESNPKPNKSNAKEFFERHYFTSERNFNDFQRGCQEIFLSEVLNGK